jgi:hypothetical protein
MPDDLPNASPTESACYTPPRIVDRTLAEGIAANAPYVAMSLLGAALFATGMDLSATAWLAAVVYVLACAGGAAWIMVFVCPWCVYHGTRGCPCGYGMVAAKLRSRAPQRGFARQFRKHIPVLALLWVAPTAAGVTFLVRGAAPVVTCLFAAYAVVAFAILPLTSRSHSCGACPQRHECPWMQRKTGAASG